jgi:hypothetical protein
MVERFKFNQQAIEWRRNIVLQKLAQGYSQIEIAKELQLHQSTISLDCQYLRIKSQEEMKIHLQDTIPFQYQKTMTGLTQVLYDLWDIAKHSTKMSERLQAYAQINDCYKHIMEASTNSTTINRAMEFVLDINQKKLEQDQEPQQQGPPPVKESDPIQEEVTEESE